MDTSSKSMHSPWCTGSAGLPSAHLAHHQTHYLNIQELNQKRCRMTVGSVTSLDAGSQRILETSAHVALLEPRSAAETMVALRHGTS